MNTCLVVVLLALTPGDLDRVEWSFTSQPGETVTYTASLSGDVFGKESLPTIAIDRNARWVIDPKCCVWPLIAYYRPKHTSYRSVLISKFSVPSQAYLPQVLSPVAAYSSTRTIQDPINPKTIVGEDTHEDDVTWPGLLFAFTVTFVALFIFFVQPWLDLRRIRRQRKSVAAQNNVEAEDAEFHREMSKFDKETAETGDRKWRQR